METTQDKAIDCLNYLFNLNVIDDEQYNNIECEIMNLTSEKGVKKNE